MPDGAQSWKMIKAPGSQNGRIAQACDRCRSKKIKCDGKRPNCSQCLAVGFECKISDKLTRRAFPRGYTESLEDRVRQLEFENNKLVNLLDLKDEQLEMMSKVHDFDKTGKDQGPAAPTQSSAPSADPAVCTPPQDDDEEYLVRQIDRLMAHDQYRGSSAGGIFIDALIDKLKTRAPEAVMPIANTFATAYSPGTISLPSSGPGQSKIIPGSRLTCDKIITTFFQEWHSMYNIVDERDLLQKYEQCMNNGGSVDHDPLLGVTIALVLAIGSLSSSSPASANEYTAVWKEWFTTELQCGIPNLDTVRALNLALLYSLHVGAVNDIWHFRMMAVNASYRLGLHRCPLSLRRMTTAEPFTVAEQNARRRAFWVTYALDAFSSAALGSPRLLLNESITTKMPSCEEDEDLEPCQLAWMTFSRLLGSIVDAFYASAHDQKHCSYKTIIKFEDQLETWKRELPSSLKFELNNGVASSTTSSPSATPVHQKSPLLLMMYHYARILIHMPASAPVDVHSTKGSGSTVASLQSAKMVLQVLLYLHQRKVLSTLCINPSRLVMSLTSVVLYSAVDYSKGGALMQEAKGLVSNCLKYLQNAAESQVPGALSPESYGWLEHGCTIVVGASSSNEPQGYRRRRSSGRRSSTGARPSVSQASSSSSASSVAPSGPTTSSSSNDAKIESPATSESSGAPSTLSPDVDEMLKYMGFESTLFQNDGGGFEKTEYQPAPPAIKEEPRYDNDYMDLWNSFDYSNLLKEEAFV
uniref:ARAD1D13288p n=1 Tax=Blastobotrys adeninivorans TaxID=409370 RepID=A0A060TE77_BLAAD